MSDVDAAYAGIAEDPGAESSPAASAVASTSPTRASRLVFTGSGGEYFRIWIVNLLLTMLTLGIYSAWAKVRKTRYFWQNTRLEGFVFDFHGRPPAILRGRILALLLLIAYSWGFQFSMAAGIFAIVLLLAIGPWLFVKAQQFKFGNTSYRGLRFGFGATYASAYRVVLPILLMWFSATVLAAVVTTRSLGAVFAVSLASLATGLLFPGMHHRLKAFQHGHATYGDRYFEFEPALWAFYRVYAKGLGLLLLGGVIAFVVGVVIGGGVAIASGDDLDYPSWLYVASSVTTILVVYVVASPFLAARLQQVVWSHTRLDGARFHTEIAAWPLFKLVLRNVLLTLVTAGIYWPFASIAIARYRVECMHVECDVPLADMAAGTFVRAVALGDAAADTFGLDIGL